MDSDSKAYGESDAASCSRAWRRWTASEDWTIEALAGNMTAAKIGSIIGRPPRCVRLRASRIGVALLMRGQANPAAKYPNLIVAACRELYEQGHTTTSIAREYGLPLKTVRAWCYGNKRLTV